MMKLLTATALVAALGAPAYAQSFNGGYVGAQLGYIDAETSGGASIDGDGIIGGVHGGYNANLGTFILGGEIDYDTMDVDLGNGTANIDSVWRLKARAGGEVGAGTMLYGTAGLAYIDTTVGDDSGYFIGAGLAQEISGGWILGGEILYHEFDDIDGTGIDAQATTLTVRASFAF